MSWRPSAGPAAIRARADLLARARGFLGARGVLEVETPTLSRAAATDPRIESLRTRVAGDGGRARYLQTSPEFPMKRLLAAHRHDIFQICKVFRDGEAGRLHNPEFTLLEWYRAGFDHHRLMDEVAALLAELLEPYRALAAPERLSYREAFRQHAGVDPATVPIGGVEARLRQAGVAPPGSLDEDRSAWLDLLLTTCVAPHLGQGRVSFVYDYPPEQAALARIRPEQPPVAERFEAYLDGLELANGFSELTDAGEQRARFTSDLAARERSGLASVPMDERLLAALAAGLPPCAGVAVGVDRVVMLATGARHIGEVLSFAFDIA